MRSITASIDRALPRSKAAFHRDSHKLQSGEWMDSRHWTTKLATAAMASNTFGKITNLEFKIIILKYWGNFPLSEFANSKIHWCENSLWLKIIQHSFGTITAYKNELICDFRDNQCNVELFGLALQLQSTYVITNQNLAWRKGRIDVFADIMERHYCAVAHLICVADSMSSMWCGP